VSKIDFAQEYSDFTSSYSLQGSIAGSYGITITSGVLTVPISFIYQDFKTPYFQGASVYTGQPFPIHDDYLRLAMGVHLTPIVDKDQVKVLKAVKVQ
jgi:hypothetical protein